MCFLFVWGEIEVVETQFDSHEVFHPEVKLDWFVLLSVLNLCKCVWNLVMYLKWQGLY
jgi:hypothetical protein